MTEIKPTTPTEHLIAELAAKMERYRIALTGCLIGATHALRPGNEKEAMAALKYIKKEASKALNETEADEDGNAL